MLLETQHAEVYDLVHGGGGRDYLAEATQVQRLVRARKPDATSLLDVGCGAGQHLRQLRQLFGHVEGVALTPEMLVRAERNVPDVPLHLGQLTDFSVGRTFDAIICLNSTLAQLPLSRLRVAVAAMARQLVVGGILIVEAYQLPGHPTHRSTAGDLVHADRGVTIAHVTHGVPRDGAHHVERHFLVADADGVRHVVDIQVLRHFGRLEYLNALASAGCGGDYLDGGLAGRSIVVGVRR